MDYYSFRFDTEASNIPILLAFLGEQPFDAFEENEDHLMAYIPTSLYEENLLDYIKELNQRFDFSMTQTHIPSKNWNAIWEAGFEPVVIDDFCRVRASFHAPSSNFPYEILIDPQMAFGTGHHATTTLCIQMMRDLDIAGKTVFDYGCGTGILAILADKMGAKEILAIDIDPASVENTIQNIGLNGGNSFSVKEGDLDIAGKNQYEIIIANINRNVLLERIPALNKQMKLEGFLILSGFLIEDEEKMLDRCKSSGFKLIQQASRGKWLCMVMQKEKEVAPIA